MSCQGQASCNVCNKGCKGETPTRIWKHKQYLVDVSDFFFFLLGEGKGESEALGRGRGSVFIENARRGGGSPRRGWRG